ncbi:MAG: hypothetical protein VX589_17140 [Myxococcota bacterium]|nr:hypothetical protein [Myxococcota bacterium]
MDSDNGDRLGMGFLLAGLANFVVLIAPLGLIESFDAVDPHFDDAGCILIALWGAAYLSIRHAYRQLPSLCLVFAIEKCSYVVRWIAWFTGERPTLGRIYADNAWHGIFFSIYGAVDAIAMLFFTVAAVTAYRNQADIPRA